MGNRLEGKVAVITGGCSGIGLATTELFVAEGAKVVIADLQDEKGQALEHRFAGAVSYVHCDVSVEEDIAHAVARATTAFGRLDVMFNNAGIGGAPEPLSAMTVDAWDKTFAVLLRAPMLGIKHAAEVMRGQGGGSVICTASIGGLEAGWSRPAYAIAKAGVIHLATIAAAELAVHGIRVNAICPGVIVTPIFDASLGRSREEAEQSAHRLLDAAAQMQPVRRAGLPADIAKAALYLASDDSSFVTGTHLVVDGGATVGARNAWDEAAAMTPLRRALFGTPK